MIHVIVVLHKIAFVLPLYIFVSLFQHSLALLTTIYIYVSLFQRSLALHRKEPAYPHANQLQSMCDVTVRYRGSNLKLTYEREDTRDEIQVFQQHCGGENLLVFHGLVEPGSKLKT